MKRFNRFILLLLAAAMLFCTCCTMAIDFSEEPIIDPKLKTDVPSASMSRVFYEIFVGSFSDSDGDGVGDLRGVINRMNYLNDGDPNSGVSLGVEGLWLSPIFKSPSYHKYDVTDYYEIDPAFGTEEDLKELLSICHERDVKVILDLPINHTGNRNAWFEAFKTAHKNGDTSSEYYDFYSWYDASQGGAAPGRTFNQIAGTQHYFECNFSGDMPELNYDSSLVRQTVVDIANYYIDLGVDGFRFDAAKYVYYGDHARSMDFWRWYMGKLREKKSDIYVVAEVWDDDGITDIYFPAMNCFDFMVSQSSGLIAETAKKGDVNRYTHYVQAYVDRVGAMREDAQYTPFVTNHDMDRAAGFLTIASGTMKMAANLYILGPGSPFIYYGEEIGMRGSRGGANTDANRRLAMVWGDEDTVKDPVGSTYPASSRAEATVAEQKQDENSIYTYYKKLLMIRRANPEIANGTYTAIQIQGSKVGGFIAEWNGSKVVVIHNTTGSAQTIDLAAVTGLDLTEFRAVIGMEDAKLEGSMLTIGSQTSVVLK